MTQEVDELLEEVDWNFTEAKASRGIHAVHPYPAKFIPQIPRKLIQLFHPPESSVILDPFCGSGTTLVEAMESGYDSVGIDVNPLACLISRVKTRLLPKGFDTTLSNVLDATKRSLTRTIEIPKIPNLDHWFAPLVQRDLTALVESINNVGPVETRESLLVALSRIIIDVSYQESDTRYAAVPKHFEAGDVLHAFVDSAHYVRSCLSSEVKLLGRTGQCTVMNRDTLSLKPEELPKEIGLVITSPPYPNAYEYWLYHKYRMYWLSMDPISVRASEIGARPHYFSKKYSDRADFEGQMGKCFELLSRVMSKAGHACFIISNSTIHGEPVDNVSALTRAAGKHGFKREGLVSRQIPDSRRSFNVHFSRKEEYLLVFRSAGSR